MAEESCQTCRYWIPKSIRQDTPLRDVRRVAKRGNCRRYAPRPSSLTLSWMDTKAEQWCGDYDHQGDADG